MPKPREGHEKVYQVSITLTFPFDWPDKAIARRWADAWCRHLRTTDRRVRDLAKIEYEIKPKWRKVK